MGLLDAVKTGAKVVGAGMAAPVAGIAAGGKALWDAGKGATDNLANDAAAKMPGIGLEKTPEMDENARRGVADQLMRATRSSGEFASDITGGAEQAGLAQPSAGEGLVPTDSLSNALAGRAAKASGRSMGRINLDAEQKGIETKSKALQQSMSNAQRQEDAQLARTAFGRAQTRRKEIERNNREAARNGAIGSVLGIVGSGVGALLGGSGGPEGAAKGMAAGANMSQATGNTQMTSMGAR